MYYFIVSEIKKKVFNNERKYISPSILQENYIMLLYLKFLCDKNNINDYSNKDNILKIIPDNKKEIYGNFFDKKLYELLIYFQNSNILELTKEFSESKGYEIFKELEDKFITSPERTIYYFNASEMSDKIIFYKNDIRNKVKVYEMLDEINNIKREIYTDLKDVDLKNIDTLVIVVDEPIYKYISNDFVVDMINNIIINYNEFKGKIILKTAYSKISILKHFMVLKYLKSVYIYENNQDAILIFDINNIEDFVSIVLVNNDNYNNIKELLTEKELKEKFSITVPKIVISKNNYRIGYKMYLPDRKEEVKSINDIVDENTKITEKITRLNKLIQEEMDKLISK